MSRVGSCLFTSGQIKNQKKGIVGVQQDFSFLIQPGTPVHGRVPLRVDLHSQLNLPGNILTFKTPK